MISIKTARELIDFGAQGTISGAAAEKQLEGAVAIHNILSREKVAYLADEVGMGKTYVALGAVALFRHFDPSFRVLFIAPRANIQAKWIKELNNFVASNFRSPDLRVKALHGAPARATVSCASLLELAREATLNPDRDFFVRMSSFSLAIGRDGAGWKERRDRLFEQIPWLPPDAFDLRGKPETFKANFARAICSVLPRFDLVIVDEGHNLKHGFRENVAWRNRLLGLCLGNPKGAAEVGIQGYERKAKRVLLLSATPLESAYKQVWNQLDVVGFGDHFKELSSPTITDLEKKDMLRRFLVRRVTTIPVAGRELTKNLYRREWRGGGVERHDEPLSIPSDMQRLVVALIQKKVSEVLGSERFNNSFQIGMLASFESFLQTAKVLRPADDDESVSNFDAADQTEEVEEKLGIDVQSINRIARDYRRHFGTDLPHPKMDALVTTLSETFATGRKALVFVRRIASVKELQRKLEEVYNERLFARLETEIVEKHRPWIQRAIERYKLEAREQRQRQLEIRERDESQDLEPSPQQKESVDAGGLETFFAWFFRGEGPDGILSGATIQVRFTQASARLSTFFEDSHVAWLLGVAPGGVIAALCSALDRPADQVEEALRNRMLSYLPRVSKQQRGNLFRAAQRAALALLAETTGPFKQRARIILDHTYSAPQRAEPALSLPDKASGWLELPTFLTALRGRPALCDRLWPGASINAESQQFGASFQKRELRRELLSAITRLGNPYVDLFILLVNRMEKVSVGAREAEGQEDLLAGDLIQLLERQMADGTTQSVSAFHELSEAASHFDLILHVNLPGIRQNALPDAARKISTLLGRQQPVGGMYGEINETLVRQFRMPGYPLVLITTDLLQEGEDLHTFCSQIFHYGISWMPSSMEQRIGRIDRVGSQSERRLAALSHEPEGKDFLEVYYPYLRETVEVLQVQRVLERMNRFLRLMHEDLGQAEREKPSVDVASEILRGVVEVEQIREPLATAFPITKEALAGEHKAPAISRADVEALMARFKGFSGVFVPELKVEWKETADSSVHFGEVLFGQRRQPFQLQLLSVEGRPIVRCSSRIEALSTNTESSRLAEALTKRNVEVSAVLDPRYKDYDMVLEGDVLLGHPEADLARVAALIERVLRNADGIENDFRGSVQPRSSSKRSIQAMSADWQRLTKTVTQSKDGAGIILSGGDAIEVQFRNGRHHLLHVRERDGDLSVWGRVTGPAGVGTLQNPGFWAWERNRSADLVRFKIDNTGGIIGEAHVPQERLGAEEWLFYLRRVAASCDRAEYVLTGRDSH